MADVVYELLAKIGVDSTELSAGLTQAKNNISSSGMPSAAKKVAKGVGAAFVAATAAVGVFGKNAIQTGMDFDAAMSSVRAVSMASGDEYERLRNLALEMGRTTKFTSQEAAEALYYMGMAGWSADEMIAGLPAVLQLAASSGEELATVSDIVTDSMTAYGMSADEAGRYANVLAATATNANTNVGLLGETFKYAAPMAGTLGYSIEDTAIAFGLMANSGIKASMAGTALRGFLTRLAKPTKESQEAMDALGISLSDGEGNMYSFMELMQNMRGAFQNVAESPKEYIAGVTELNDAFEQGELSEEAYEAALADLISRNFQAPQEIMAALAAELGGQRALAGLLAIVNASEEDFDSLTKAIYGANEAYVKTADGSVMPMTEAMEKGLEVVKEYNGAAEAMADIMQDNLSGDVTRLKSAWEGFKIQFADKFTPELRRVMPRIIEAVGRLTEKLGDMDLSALADGIATLAEKAIDFLSWLLEHGVDLAEKVSKIIGWFTNNPAKNSVVGGTQEIIANTQQMMAATELGAGHTEAEYAANYNRWQTAAEMAEALANAGEIPFDDYLALVEAASQAYLELNSQTGRNRKWADQFREDNPLEFSETDLALYRAALGQIELDAATAANNAGAPLAGLSTQAFGWGSDMITQFSSGMNASAAASLLPTVLGVAGMVSSYLHHSEPDVGPMSDDSTWMPDMMQGFAEDIRAGAPEIESALNDAFDVHPGVTIGAAAGGGFGSQYTFNVMIDGDIINPREKAEALLYEMRAILDREEMGYA